jgi:hypothetical protein
MKRSILGFNLVQDADHARLDEVRNAVEMALNCTFEPGRHRGIDADITDLLGMSIALYQWRGQGDGTIFRLDTDIHDERLYAAPPGEALEFEEQDISRSVASLLQARGAGIWRVPTDDDVTAGSAYRVEYDKQFEVSADDIRRWEAGE